MRSAQLLVAMTVIMLTPSTLRSAFAEQHEQHAQHPPHNVSTSALRLDVDGSKNPERVSDYTAYRQFIITAAARNGSSDQDRKHRRAFIRRIGLSAGDEAVLDAALRNVLERLDSVSAQKQSLGAAAPEATQTALRQQEEAVLEGANRRIRAFLSKEGWRQLEQFVRQQVKPTIKVFSNRSR
jgi:hypothetical protein